MKVINPSGYKSIKPIISIHELFVQQSIKPEYYECLRVVAGIEVIIDHFKPALTQLIKLEIEQLLEEEYLLVRDYELESGTLDFHIPWKNLFLGVLLNLSPETSIENQLDLLTSMIRSKEITHGLVICPNTSKELVDPFFRSVDGIDPLDYVGVIASDNELLPYG